MNIYGNIYLLIKYQGEYDEYQITNICAFKTKDLADYMRERYEQSFSNLYSFYNSKLEEIEDAYGTRMVHFPDYVFELYCIFLSKKNKFSGADFGIQEIKIRRFR